ncbi:hypothetical protein T4B_829 [Trichinella pseudospiralis]|uniref:Uncharacterized protein n=1 Tax=Trichinella pseudospiralis TaxID=6337 RepID=A0A0V1GPZ4_TRIPS|nr:hypothetical protein T4B_829 [Trichinella pseudospiralis]
MSVILKMPTIGNAASDCEVQGKCSRFDLLWILCVIIALDSCFSEE